EQRVSDDVAAVSAVQTNDHRVLVVELGDLRHVADGHAVLDHRIAAAQRAGVMKNDGGLDLTAMRKISRTEPHEHSERDQGNKFANHVLSQFVELSIHFMFMLKPARHLASFPEIRWRRKPMAVADKVKSIIVEQLGVDAEEVTDEASFVEDLGADSLDTVELVMAFEEEFGIEIPDEDAEKITRVKEAIDYIEAHAKSKK